MTKEVILQRYGDNLEERAEKVLEHVADSRRALEAEFRHLLGMQSGVTNKKTEVSSLNDLMWIPQPGTIDPIEWPQQADEQDAPPPSPPEPVP